MNKQEFKQTKKEIIKALRSEAQIKEDYEKDLSKEGKLYRKSILKSYNLNKNVEDVVRFCRLADMSYDNVCLGLATLRNINEKAKTLTLDEMDKILDEVGDINELSNEQKEKYKDLIQMGKKLVDLRKKAMDNYFSLKNQKEGK